MAEQMVGTVESVIGPVVDFSFPEGQLPEIYDAIRVTMDDGFVQTFEVEQQVGNNVVRTVSMGSTDGLRRGMPGVSDGVPISVPVVLGWAEKPARMSSRLGRARVLARPKRTRVLLLISPTRFRLGSTSL